MQRQHLRGAAVVVGAAVGAFLFYGPILQMTGRDVQLMPVVWSAPAEGMLIGAAVLASWTLSRSRRAAAAGLAAALGVVLLGALGFGPALLFMQTPLGWAVVLTLIVRVCMPEASISTATTRDTADV